MAGTPIRAKESGTSSKILSIPQMSITSKRRSLLRHKFGIIGSLFFLSGIARAASVVTGYVQTAPPGVQPANPNVTTITAGQVIDTGLSVGGCVQASGAGVLSATGLSCGAGGGGGGGANGNINTASQYSAGYYSFMGSSNVISGLPPGTSGQVLMTAGTSATPYFGNVLGSNIVLPSAAIPFGSASSLMTTDVTNFKWDDTNKLLYLNPSMTFSMPTNESVCAGDTVGCGGSYQTCIGDHACNGNTGISNIGIGFYANAGGNSGSENIAIGEGAMQAGAGGGSITNNIAIGQAALAYPGSLAEQNVAIGVNALSAVQPNGNYGESVAIGAQALASDTYGVENTAVGMGALTSNLLGIDNVAIGHYAMSRSTQANSNVAIGYSAGGDDLSLPSHPGWAAIHSQNGLFLGANAGVASTSTYYTDATAIGYQAAVANSYTIQMGGYVFDSVTTRMSSMTVDGTSTFGGPLTQNISGVAYTLTSSTGPSITAGHCAAWTGAYTLADAGAACGSGSGTGVTVYPATSTILANQGISGTTFTFTGPAQSTVTYGMTVGSMNVVGVGDGQIILTIGVSTYVVTSATTPIPAIGHLAVWTSTNGTLGDGGGGVMPSGPNYSVQVDSNGVFGGSSNFVWNGTSLTVQGSSISVTSNGASVPNAFFSVFGNGLASGTDVFAVGGSATSPLFEVPFNNVVKMTESGASIGNLQIGGRSDGDNIGNSQSLYETPNTSGAQGIDIYDGSGNMDFGTASVGQGGTSGRINFTIAQTGITGAGGTTEMVISSFGVTISTSLTVASSMTIVAPTSIPYSLLVTTSATPSTFFHVAISTNGHILSNGPAPTISACGAGPNGSVVGDDTQGTISIGGGSVTGCTLTFANNFGSGCTVNCTTSDSITTSTPDVVTTSTTMTLGFSASIGGGKVLYHCTGYGATCK
jgi:hypothetical protein